MPRILLNPARGKLPPTGIKKLAMLTARFLNFSNFEPETFTNTQTL